MNTTAELMSDAKSTIHKHTPDSPFDFLLKEINLQMENEFYVRFNEQTVFGKIYFGGPRQFTKFSPGARE